MFLGDLCVLYTSRLNEAISALALRGFFCFNKSVKTQKMKDPRNESN